MARETAGIDDERELNGAVRPVFELLSDHGECVCK
jgi:hypothetical protein